MENVSSSLQCQKDTTIELTIRSTRSLYALSISLIILRSWMRFIILIQYLSLSLCQDNYCARSISHRNMAVYARRIRSLLAVPSDASKDANETYRGECLDECVWAVSKGYGHCRYEPYLYSFKH